MIFRNIIVGVTGGIAAYKSCELIRLLQKAGHQVRVIMTEGAKQFIHPNTFAALTHNHAYDSLFANAHDAMLHIALAKWADTIVIAPASATTISRLVAGCADDLLSCVCLASEAVCYVAPAMNKVMWSKPVMQKNIAELSSFGYQLLMPEAGEQACGDRGVGRMMAPERICQALTAGSSLLAGLNIVITAGATQERIDPVRYISNFSSGKMGYALAKACQQQGAKVTLITGPTCLTPPPFCETQQVTSAETMLTAVMMSAASADIFISAAAIADYKPAAFSPAKIKKIAQQMTIALTKTPDIVSTVTASYPKLFTVGFCAETHDLASFAKAKLKNKKLSAIIANKISETGYPFGEDTNELLYINHREMVQLPRNTKVYLAHQLVQQVFKDFKTLS